MIIVLDGVDGTGKSSLCALARARLSCEVHSEFSASPLGVLIDEIIAERRFFSLGSRAYSPASELYCMMADAAHKYEAAFMSDAGLQFFDRGVLSALAYQSCRLESKAENSPPPGYVERLLRSFFDLLPRAESVKHINLVVSSPEMQARLVGRGETALDNEHLSLMMRIQERMVAIGRQVAATDIFVDGKDLEGVFGEICEVVGLR